MLRNLRFWAELASLFLLRSGRSTLVLSLMIIAAVATMIFLSAMAVGINDAMIRNSVTLYSGHIAGFNLPAALEKTQLMVKGVKTVLKRIPLPGILSHKNHLETVTMIAVNPAEELKATAIAKKTVSGKYPDQDDSAVYLSVLLAEKLAARPEDTVYFSVDLVNERLPLKVSGTYETGVDHLDRGLAFCPQHALNVRDSLWLASIFLHDGVDPFSITEQYRNELPETGAFKAWAELMPDLKQLIDLNYVSMGLVMVLVFSVVSLGVGCAFVIFILKNVREFGIMKAMGVTPSEVTTLIAMEVLLMTLVAASVGMFIGAVVTLLTRKVGIDLTSFTSHNRYFTVSGVIHPRLTLFSLLTPPGLAFCSGLAAAVWPIALVIRRRAADILRIV